MKRFTFFTKKTGVLILAGCMLFASLAFVGCGGGASNGESLYEKKCSSCHSLDIVDSASYSGAEEWAGVVDRMADMTTTISDSDR